MKSGWYFLEPGSESCTSKWLGLGIHQKLSSILAQVLQYPARSPVHSGYVKITIENGHKCHVWVFPSNLEMSHSYVTLPGGIFCNWAVFKTICCEYPLGRSGSERVEQWKNADAYDPLSSSLSHLMKGGFGIRLVNSVRDNPTCSAFPWQRTDCCARFWQMMADGK